MSTFASIRESLFRVKFVTRRTGSYVKLDSGETSALYCGLG